MTDIPSFDDFWDLVARAVLAADMGATSASPIEITTSDGAILSFIVVKHPWEEERRWDVKVQAIQ